MESLILQGSKSIVPWNKLLNLLRDLMQLHKHPLLIKNKVFGMLKFKIEDIYVNSRKKSRFNELRFILFLHKQKAYEYFYIRHMVHLREEYIIV